MRFSCKTITHGRVHLLEEAIYSFLIQDYEGEYEMIIVNDCPFQNLIYDHPRIKIYNLKEMFPTIGDKENYAIERCSGEVIVVWDDDDIAMPWHLSQTDYYIKDNNLLFWAKGVYYNEPEITSITSVGNSGIAYRKDAWFKIGKSPIENAGGDMTLVNRLIALDPNKVARAYPGNDKVSWFYRWRTPLNYHQSGMGTDTPDRPSVVERNAEYVRYLRKARLIPEGDVYLKPKWRYDYKKMLEDYVRNNMRETA